MAKKLLALTAWFAVVWMTAVAIFLPVIAGKKARAQETQNWATIVVFAEENTTEAVDEGETEAVPEESPTQAETTVVEAHTFGSRIEEWFSKNFLEVMSSVNLSTALGCVAAIIVEKRSNKRNANGTNAAIEANTAATKENTESNDKVLDVVNLLIDGTNELLAGEVNRDEAIAKLTATMQAVLEILVTVYANNKNIPQAVKDFVNVKYVGVLKNGVKNLLQGGEDKKQEE